MTDGRRKSRPEGGDLPQIGSTVRVVLFGQKYEKFILGRFSSRSVAVDGDVVRPVVPAAAPLGEADEDDDADAHEDNHREEGLPAEIRPIMLIVIN